MSRNARSRAFRILASMIFTLASLAQGLPNAKAANLTQQGPIIVVTSNDDHTPDGCTPEGAIGTGFRDCTLREAILSANATAGPNTIIFSAVAFSSGIFGRLPLSGPLPAIEEELTIDALSNEAIQRVYIDGMHLYQILTVNNGVKVTLLGTSFNYGVGANCGGYANSGGGLCNDGGTVEILGGYFLSNTSADYGGAIFNLGTLTLTHTTVDRNTAQTGYGGAILNLGTLTVDNSQVLMNTALNSSTGYGGAIMNFGTVHVTNSLFQENVAHGGLGGAILTDGGAITNVANSTFWRNKSVDGYGGGALYNGGGGSTMTVINSTFVDNDAGSGAGSGINNWGILRLTNSLFANRTPGGDCVNNATITGHHNLIEESGSACGFTNGTGGNLIGVDAKVGDLAFYSTMAPFLPGSPAIDAGDDAICAATPINNLDTLGVTRPQGAHCDIGAFESQGEAVALTKSADPMVYRANGDQITYRYEIKNVGLTVFIGLFYVVDDQLGEFNCESGSAVLSPGETTSCTSVYTITAQDMEKDFITNTAFAKHTGSGIVSPAVTLRIDKATFEMALKKSADRATYSSVGEVITYNYAITNEGNVALTAPFSVIDDKLGTISPCGVGPLAPGASTSCTAPYTVKQSDIDFGSITNEAHAQGGGATSCIECNNKVTVTWQAAPAADTTTTLTTSPNPSTVIEDVVLKATVQSGAGTPAGSVTFLDGATVRGSAQLDGSGAATLILKALSFGTHTMTAKYEGSNGFKRSTSAPVDQVVTKQDTTFTLRLLHNPSAPGEETTFAVRLLPNSQLQTGSVHFYHEDGLLGSELLRDMTDSATNTKYRGAEFTINDLPPGVHSIRVRYDGDRNFTAATSAIALQTITGKQGPTVDLRSSDNPAAVGAKVTLVAHLQPDSDRPTGSVTFFDGTTALGTVALANGCGINGPVCREASFETSTLTAGVHTITAKYSGDDSFTEATSAPLQQTISTAPVTNLTPIALTVAPGNKSIKLAWNVTNDPMVTSYRILRNAGENDRFETIADPWNDPTFFDKGTESVPLVAGITYCYRIEARRSDGSLALSSNRACGIFGSLALSVPDAIGRPGETVIVPVEIRNADGLRIAASDIWLEFNSEIVESVAVSRTALTADYAWDSSVQDTANPPTKVLRIALINLQPATLHGDGALFWLVFKVKGQAGQSSPLDLKELITAGGSSIQDIANLSQDVPLQLTDGTFRVESAGAGYIRGDVDGNGRVAALDALVALSLAAGKRPAAANELQAGDVNSNSRMDSADASMILYYAARGSWPVPPQGSITSAAARHGDTTVHLSSGSAQPGGRLLVTLGATDLIEMAGGDFVITYDAQVVKRVVGVTQTGLAASFPTPAFHDSGNGLLTIALSNGSEINGSGALLTIELELQSNAPQGASPLTLADAKLNDSFGRDFIAGFDDNQLARQSGVITVGDGSGGTENTIFLPVVSR